MPEENVETPEANGNELKKPLNLHLTDLQKDIFDSISKNDLPRLKLNLIELKTSIDYYDDNGMTPLQHACYKGNKEAVQICLDRGANVNSSKHQYDYTALHFAALSGSVETCMLLLLAGANSTAMNTVQRTPSQMAAFVGNKAVVQTINNFIPKSEIEPYVKANGGFLSQVLADPLHRFVMILNLHPVRIALFLQKHPLLLENLKQLKKVMDAMAEKEMKRKGEPNEVMSLKFHYLGWIVGELNRAKETASSRDADKQTDFIELFTKKVLKPAKDGQMDYLEITIKDCIREFPWRECTIFRQVVNQLVSKSNTLPAFDILRQSIYGHNTFADQTPYCDACGEENPTKKCSKCKTVQYCDRECQRLHWFAHKKVCAREATAPTDQTSSPKEPIDMAELQGALSAMKGK